MAGVSVEKLCRPLSPEDFIQEATLRILELAGHEDRDIEGWRVMVARHACQDLLSWNAQRVKRAEGLELIEGVERLELAKERLKDVVPQEVLDIASKLVNNIPLTQEEQERLGVFKKEQ